MKKIVLFALFANCLILGSTVTTYLEKAKKHRENEEFDQMIEDLVAARAIAPSNGQIYFDLAFGYLNLGQVDNAIAMYDALLKQMPDTVAVLYNKAYALKMKGDFEQAIAIYQQILSLSPDYEPAQFGYGHTLLQFGDFHEGWKQHEIHLKSMKKNGEEIRAFLRGRDLEGKRILLVPEGGLGDTIQFIRYAQLLHDHGVFVIAAVQKPLLKLLALVPYIDQLIPIGSPAPKHDGMATLMSMPAICNSDEETIPKKIPYIYADPDIEQYWHEKLSGDTNFKIGICWQSDVGNDASRPPVARRGMPLEKLYPLSNFEHVSLYSLQKYNAADLEHKPDWFKIQCFDDFDSSNGSFMDTVAIMKQMDLIISVDTAIPHLAGALGVPIWLLLPYSTDWRWIHNRTDSPWYPTMQIFKQPAPFDWDSVMQDLLANLIMILQTKR